jgi:hypothetical protein
MLKYVILLLILILVGGLGALAFLDIPAPTATIEKPIANDRLQPL